MTPSDDDLDCLLKTWTVPRSPDSLKRRLRRAYRDSRKTPFLPTVGKFAGMIAGAVVLLLVITRAFPQSLGLIVPPGAMIIDSELRNYADDGSSTVSEYRTSSFSSLNGYATLSSSFPGDPLRTAVGELLKPLKVIILTPILQRMGRQRDMHALEMALAARIRNGCVPTNMWGRPMTVIGKETVLNYTTTVSQFTPEDRDERFTEWFAPALDCVSLRSTTEKALSDGTFRLVSETRVLKVTR